VRGPELVPEQARFLRDVTSAPCDPVFLCLGESTTAMVPGKLRGSGHRDLPDGIRESVCSAPIRDRRICFVSIAAAETDEDLTEIEQLRRTEGPPRGDESAA
jgi:hypothetical protein